MNVAVLASCAGAALVGVILWEAFADLFHPADHSALGEWIGRTLFSLFRRVPRLLTLAGPLALLVLVGTWVAGVMIGFALIYAGWFPDQFRTSSLSIPSGTAPFLSALYFSFETLITLGYGDLVPRSFLLRFTATAEALIGFGLLTASLSEIVLLYPALSRLRLLARSVAHVVAGESQCGIHLSETGSDVLLAQLARDVTHARIDLVHFPIVYYFATRKPEASIATWTHQLCRLAQEGMRQGTADRVRLAAAVLDDTLTELAVLLATRFLRVDADDRKAVFDAFALDHCVRPA
jgi:hypothetical protein